MGENGADETERLRRRVAELELRVAETGTAQLRYERVLGSLPQQLFLKDPAGRFVLVNAAFAASIGQRVSDMVGKTDHDLFSVELADKYRADDLRVMAQRRPETLIEPHDMAGERRFVEVTKAPVIDDGEVIGLVGVFADVTGRVRAESQVRQQRKLLQAILDNSQAVITIKDREGRYQVINRRFEQAFGVMAKDFIGKTDDELFPPREAAIYRENDRRVFEFGRAVELEEVIPLADGPHTFIVLKFPVEVSGGKTLSVCGISTDITERKRAEQALKEGEARKSAILDSALDCVLTVDHDFRIVEFNPAAEREFRCRRDEVVGKDLAETIFPPSAETQYKGRIGNYFQNSQGSLLGRLTEASVKRKDGSLFPVEMGMTMVAFQGKPIMTITLRNITHRKEAEAAIQRQQKQLAHQADELERRNQALQHAYAELQEAEGQLIHSEKMAVVGQLVAGLAHEINTPVAFVVTNLSNLQRNLDDLTEYANGVEEVRLELAASHAPAAARLADLRDDCGVEDAVSELHPMLESAKKGMMRIKDLVANLRSFSRIDKSTDLAEEDLNEGVEATLMLCQPLLKNPDLRIERRFGKLPRVECNMGPINQVFMNLITNAIQAVGDKAGTVTITTEAANGGVAVRIRDDGPGIPKEIAARVFDPFFTTKPVGQGTGLGLSICRKIVDSHHGHLTFTSSPGAGTEFRLWLPLIQSQARPPSTLPVTPPAGAVPFRPEGPDAEDVLDAEDIDRFRSDDSSIH